MLAHALFPQIPQGLLPVVVKEGENLLQVPVFKSIDVLSQLLQSAPSLGFTVRMVEEMHQLSDEVSDALHKPGILAFQLGNRLLFLTRYIGWLLAEAPTPLPERLGTFHDLRIVVCFTICLDVPAVGAQRFFEVPPDMLDRMAMVGLQSRLRPYRFDRFGGSCTCSLRIIR